MSGARPFLRSHTPLSISSVVAATQNPVEPRTIQMVTAYDTAIGTTEKLVWRSASQYQYPANASTLSIVSTNAVDTANGTGARTVGIVGLNANFEDVIETVTLNGTTPVITTNQYIRLNSARVLTAGSDGKMMGNTTLTHTGSGFVLGTIIDGDDKTTHGSFTVPSNRIGMLQHLTVSVGKSQDCTFKIYFRDQGSVFRIFKVINLFEQAITIPYEIPFPLRPGIDIEMRAYTSSGTASVSASMCIIQSGIV